MNKTKIEWCDYTWNPVVGCQRGCPYCYAKRIAIRFKMDFNPHLIPKRLEDKCPKGKIIFANSMSDPEYWLEDWKCELGNYAIEHPESIFILLSKDKDTLDYWKDIENIRTVWTITHPEQLLEDYKGYINLEPLFFIPEVNQLEKYKGIIIGLETGNRKYKWMPDKELFMSFIFNLPASANVFLKDTVINYLGLFLQVENKKEFWKIGEKA